MKPITQEASVVQTAAGVVGPGFYESPRRIKGITEQVNAAIEAEATAREAADSSLADSIAALATTDIYDATGEQQLSDTIASIWTNIGYLQNAFDGSGNAYNALGLIDENSGYSFGPLVQGVSNTWGPVNNDDRIVSNDLSTGLSNDGFFGAVDATTVADVRLDTTLSALAANLTAETTRATAAESTLAASRAPLQGINIVRYAGSVATLLNPPTIGTSDFSVFANIVPDAFGGNQFILQDTEAGGMTFYVNPSGYPTIASTSVTEVGNSTVQLVAGQTYLVGYTRAGSVGKFYVNGQPAGTITDTENYTGSTQTVGGANSNAPLSIYRPVIVNRAWSAAEVAAYAQSGQLSATDAGIGSNTQNTSLIADTGSPAVSSSTAVTFSGSESQRVHSPLFNYVSGQTVLVTGSMSGLSGAIHLYGNYGPLYAITADGAFSFVMILGSSGPNAVFIDNVSSNSGAITDLNVQVIGALLNPAVSPPGSGYQWRDESGNGADITLPATSVTWAQPATGGANSVRAVLSWSGTHEAKSLLGQVALPPNAVIQSLTLTASAATSGTGATVGTTNTATRWLASTPLSAARAVFVGNDLENLLCASDAAGDCDLVVVPDSANYTGSIAVTVSYTLAL